MARWRLREAFGRHSWLEVYTQLADSAEDLDADVLEMLAVAANLLGVTRRAFGPGSGRMPSTCVAVVRPGHAERCRAALTLMLRGDMRKREVDDTTRTIVEELEATYRSRRGACCSSRPPSRR